MTLHDTWASLRHGGNLLEPAAIDALPALTPPRFGTADKLRSGLVALTPEKPTQAAIGDLLDIVLEGICGLQAGWRKGPQLGPDDSERLLDGTDLKPRRLWTGPAGESLAVFTAGVDRIGVGKGRRAAARVLEYLRRRGLPLGLLTNGRQWRLLWADTDTTAWVEWDADRWLDADQLSPEALLLRRLLSPLSLGVSDPPLSPLLTAIRESRRGQAKLSKELGERVRQAVEALLESRQPVIGPDWDDHAGADLYVAASHFIMRLVVVLFAEARELLPCDNPVYHQAYGLRGLIDQLNRLSAERRRSRTMGFPRLMALFRLLHQGSPHPAVAVPAYGGDLFRTGDPAGDGVQRALALLESLSDPPDDEVLHRILILLTRTTHRVREGSGWRSVATPVDFTELTSEYIGILYEGLLDYELHLAGDHPVVFLNLGDQPALPLDRLEAMDDAMLKALVEKAKVKKEKAAAGDEEADGDDSDDETADDGNTDDEESADDTEPSPAVATGFDELPDDTRVQQRSRAIEWAKRAAIVGKLVRKPSSRKAEALATFEATLAAASQQLIADLKLPGELYLIRWGGTRKGAGTFYTRPQLTMPTVRRTLEPLIHDIDGTVRPPEDLLALKVCDPAMGSGSFLVAGLRTLTAAVVESLHIHDRIDRQGNRVTIACDLLPDADRALPTEGFEEQLEAIVRRAVVEHSLYGVDIDPLAVELARVALWVETLDRRLPFTFLDHKLRCGDSLLGTWLDQFRDYPLMAFERESPDKKGKWTHGVLHAVNTWHAPLREKRKEAISEQADILAGQLRIDATATDEELKAAVERVRRLYRELRAVPAGRPDERARIWRERIHTDASMAKVRQAFDAWCAIWFWPLDRLDLLPMPATLAALSPEANDLVTQVRNRYRFLHWELEFPDVFTGPAAGFDAVFGNPPWEISKPNSKEFFSNHDPLFRAYGKQQALAEQKALFAASQSIEEGWLDYLGSFKDRGNFVRYAAAASGETADANGKPAVMLATRKEAAIGLHEQWRRARSRYRGTGDPAHPFRHQGSADLNTYKMFIEMGHAVLKQGGQLGLVVPSGLYTDKGTGDLRRLLLQGCRWRWLYGFENRNKVFDIDSRFKFCVTIAEKGGETTAIRAAFMRHDLEDWAGAEATLSYPAERVAAFSPKSLSILEIRSEKDLEVLTKIYANSVLLGDDSEDGWGITYATEFHMTNDSRLFIGRDKAEAAGFQPDPYGRWVNADGEVLLPLYEGRMVGQFDFSEKGWVSGKGRSAVWREIPWSDKKIEPQFLMRHNDWIASLQAGHDDKARIVGTKTTFMAIGSATNRRSMFATVLRDVPCGNAVPVLQPRGNTAGALGLTAVLDSLAYDFALRARLGGLNLNYFVISETPLLSPDACGSRFTDIAARLCLSHPWFSPNWMELQTRDKSLGASSSWALTDHERTRQRAASDAIIATQFGLRRDDFAWILRDCDHSTDRLSDKAFCRTLDTKGFWRIDKEQDPELRHTVLSVAAFDDLQGFIAAAGSRDAGIEAWCAQNDGDGWMLPETLCLADLGLTRTVSTAYDERAKPPNPFAAVWANAFSTGNSPRPPKNPGPNASATPQRWGLYRPWHRQLSRRQRTQHAMAARRRRRCFSANRLRNIACLARSASKTSRPGTSGSAQTESNCARSRSCSARTVRERPRCSSHSG